MSFSRTQASGDPGAFGMLDTRQERILKGRLYHLEAILVRQPRRADEWSYSLLYGLHRQMFAGIFPEQAGKERLTEVTHSPFTIPMPGQIKDHLRYLIEAARSLIEESIAMAPSTKRTELVFTRAAMFHANSVVTQPFIDGNKRWARLLLNVLLVDCGFKPGTFVHEEERAEYIASIVKALAADPEQLGTILLRGYVEQSKRYRAGMH